MKEVGGIHTVDNPTKPAMHMAWMVSVLTCVVVCGRVWHSSLVCGPALVCVRPCATCNGPPPHPFGVQMSLIDQLGAGKLFRRWLYYLPRVRPCT